MTDKEAGKALREFRLNTLHMGLCRFAKWFGVKPSQRANIEHGRRFDEPPPDIESEIRDGKFFPICPTKMRKLAAKILQEKRP